MLQSGRESEKKILGTREGGKRNLLQYPDNPRLRLMKDQVVDLVVAVNERRAVLGLCAPVLEEGNHVVEVRDLADRHVRLDVDGLRLRLRDRPEGRDLPVVEAGGLAEVGQPDRGGVYAVQFRERSDRIVPPASRSVRSMVVRGDLALRRCAVAGFVAGGSRERYISVRSSGVTPGSQASSMMRPSRNSMM